MVYRTGADALFAVCQSSEMQKLSLEERVALAKGTVSLARGRIPVIASGHISESREDQRTELKAMAETGIDALVLVSNRLDPANAGSEAFQASLEAILSWLPNDLQLGLYECPAPYRRLLTDDEFRLCRDTGRASILINAKGQNMIAVAPGANSEASADVIDDTLLRDATIVLMQMENDVSEIERLIRRAKNVGTKTILNLAPAIPLEIGSLSLCDLIVVNDDEAGALAGWLACEPSAPALSRRLNTGVLRTLGGEGAEAFSDGREVKVSAMAVNVEDTTAAGDCFVGVLASALDRGLSLEASMRRATRAAGIACSRRGSQASIPFATETDSWPGG
ncbi:PfkB family carbohydrate kinase [Sinorhizobium sp. 8-89]|uniref:PfkB family carbohydrate kinase n=1 Tax=Sinorhizobium sp. 7-81 TaxID=3049087 RepID=UPI0024C344F3|nr:PfkB family carbohydrate kinase [Sinorhizobium sp. 7-81]MDK1389782.1 PfkB family carbohydrate kinase [Sinorhizobium sp. 7-81]